MASLKSGRRRVPQLLAALLWGTAGVVSAAPTCLPSQQEALEQFFGAAADRSNCCAWPSVGCSAEGHVVGLSVQGLASIGGNLASLQRLTHLGRLQLADLPSVQGDLASLRSLANLVLLQLVSLPSVQGDLASLQNLTHLDALGLQDLPSAQGDLASLQSLANLSHLELTDLPSVQGDLASLQNLTHLGILAVAAIPSVQGDLASLENLTHLGDLRLMKVPSVQGDLASLQNLTNLVLLALTFLPSVQGDLASLRSLALLGTLDLEELPSVQGDLASLQNLTHLGDLSLTSLPSVQGDLASLQNLTNLEILQLNSVPSVQGDLASLRSIASSLQLANLPLVQGDLASLRSLTDLNQIQLINVPWVQGDLASLWSLADLDFLQLNKLPSVQGDLASLRNLANLVTLGLQDLPSVQGDLASLRSLTHLRTLGLDELPSVQGDLASLRTNLRLIEFINLPSVRGDLASLRSLAHLGHLILTSLPSVQGDLASLKHLTNLGELGLDDLPSVQGDLASLWSLAGLSYLHLAILPSVQGDLASLRSLTDLSYLDLSSLPSVRGDLASLRSLAHMETLKLKILPSVQGDLASLQSLTHLSYLELEYLPLVKGDLGSLRGLTQLSSLLLQDLASIRGNLSSIATLMQLETLRISGAKLSGGLPAAGDPPTLPLGRLRHLALPGIGLKGSVPALPSRLELLDLSRNNFVGFAPNVSHCTGLQFLAIQDNAFVGPLPHLPEHRVRDSPWVVFAHGNLLSGTVKQDAVAPNLSFVVATPGNLLWAPLPPWLRDGDPVLEYNGRSPMLYNSVGDNLMALLPAACFLVLWAVAVRCYSGGAREPEGRALEEPEERAIHGGSLTRIVVPLRALLRAHCLAGIALGAIYAGSAQRYRDGRLLLVFSAAYCQDVGLIVASVIWVLLAVPTVRQVLALPRGVPGHFSRCSIRGGVAAGFAWLLAVLGCASPGIGYVCLMIIPSRRWVGAWLPPLSAVLQSSAMILTAVVQPVLAQALARRYRPGEGEEEGKLRLLSVAGLVSWMMPLVALCMLSENCGSYWSAFLHQCNGAIECTSCKTTQKFGISAYCDTEHKGPLYTQIYCAQPFDFCAEGDWQLEGSGVLTKVGKCSLADTSDLCSSHWRRGDRCTMALMETLGALLLGKLLYAAIMPLAVLLLCRVARAPRRGHPTGWCPVALFMSDPQGMHHRPEVFLRIGFGPCSKTIGLSEKLGAQQVALRLCIWTEVGLAWGPIMPLIAAAALLVISVEQWCHQTAEREYTLPCGVGDTRVVRTYIVVGLVASYVLCAAHIWSASGL